MQTQELKQTFNSAPFGMSSGPKILQQLNGEQIRLSKSDRKLAAIVTSQPEEVIHLSIAKLASLADVSEPTVNRFCHKLGCKGYPEFKLRLAQEISSGGHLFVENMSEGDDSAAVIQKILNAIQGSVQSLGNSLDPTELCLLYTSPSPRDA